MECPTSTALGCGVSAGLYGDVLVTCTSAETSRLFQTARDEPEPEVHRRVHGKAAAGAATPATLSAPWQLLQSGPLQISVK